jgi:hypothetical protein
MNQVILFYDGMAAHYHLIFLFGAGERIVFLPYTDAAFGQTQDWMSKHRLFVEETG